MKNVVVILNYNDAQATIQLVESIANYSSINGIVIVDNCSSDNSYDLLKKKYEDSLLISVLKTGYNGGYAYGNNWGCDYAIDKLGADVITISNPDIFFSNDVMTKMLQALDRNDVACVSAICHCDNNLKSPSAWKLPKYKDCLIEDFIVLRKIIGNRLAYSDNYINRSQYVNADVLSGAFFSIKASVFEECRGFDEDTFLYYEENILGYKVKELGMTNLLITDEYYTHVGSASISKNVKKETQKFKYLHDSKRIYMKKYLHCKNIMLLFEFICYKVGLFNFGLVKGIARVLNVF